MLAERAATLRSIKANQSDLLIIVAYGSLTSQKNRHTRRYKYSKGFKGDIGPQTPAVPHYQLYKVLGVLKLIFIA